MWLGVKDGQSNVADYKNVGFLCAKFVYFNKIINFQLFYLLIKKETRSLAERVSEISLN